MNTSTKAETGTTLRLWDGYPHTSPELEKAVRELQAALTGQGFQTSVDGRFGPVTAANVMRFQAAMGLAQDGVAGARVWVALAGGTPLSVLPFETTLLRGHASLLAQAKCAQRYEAQINAAARTAGVAVAVICGIGSRESNWGLALTPPGPAGTGDFIRRSTPRGPRTGALPPDGGGFGRGLMQIDYDAHEFARSGNWRDAVANIAYSATVLRESLGLIRRRHPDMAEEGLLRAAVAGYNCGPGNVLAALRDGRDVDYFTHGRDYSRAVLNYAGWFQLHGW